MTSDDKVVVADTQNNRIQVCSTTGSCKLVGTPGSGDRNFLTPAGVAVDVNDRIIVADSFNHRVQILQRSQPQAPVNAGMNDAWYEPATAGQGFFFDFYPSIDTVFVLWFTFDSKRPDSSVPSKLGGPGQRWYTAQGKINADNVAELNVYLTEGGVFSQESPKPTTSSAGIATLRFNSCKEAEFEYNLADPGLTGSIDLQRIALDNVALCEYLASRQDKPVIDRLDATANAVPAGDWVEISWEAPGADWCLPTRGPEAWLETPTDPAGGSAWFLMEQAGTHDFTLECSRDGVVGLAKTIVTVDRTEASGVTINEGMNAAWFNAALAGQGFYFNVYPDIKKVFFSWFTFDSERPPAGTEAIVGEPGHRWLTGLGPFDGNSATIDVSVTTGGVFDSGTPKASTEINGRITVEFSDCRNAVVKYDLPQIAAKGEIPVKRIVEDGVPLCESLSGQSGGGDDGGKAPTRSGTWRGRGTNSDFSVYSTCFFLADNLQHLASSSLCPNNSAFNVKIEDATDSFNQKCSFELSYGGQVPIENNRFSVKDYERFPGDFDRWDFEGVFDGNTASGTATRKNSEGFSCTGKWTAKND